MFPLTLDQMREARRAGGWGDTDEWERKVYEAEDLARQEYADNNDEVTLVNALRVLYIELEDLRELHSGETSEAEIERLKRVEQAALALRKNHGTYRALVDELDAALGERAGA